LLAFNYVGYAPAAVDRKNLKFVRGSEMMPIFTSSNPFIKSTFPLN
jgi:hypothetical protein